MRKSSKSRSDNSSSSSVAAERLADYRGDSSCAPAAGSSSSIPLGPVSPNVSPSTPDTESTCGTSSGTFTNSSCSAMLEKLNLSHVGDSEPHPTNQPESSGSSSKDGGKEKKLSSGSLGSGDAARPKQVTVTHPGTNKAKRTSKKKGSIQADLDVAKEFLRCKEEGSTR
ncbi:hypothetical protein X975_07749, partial [Stegodyphus mimosarum]